MESKSELIQLEKIAVDSWYGRGVNASMVEYSFRVFSRHLRGENILELGPAEGIMTALLAPRNERLTVVEGAATFCEDLRRKFPQVEVVHTLFEDFRPKEKFNNIILGHVLEHVEDPIGILRLVKTWLKPDGRVLAAVPNSRSLHRQAAVIMGLLPFEEAKRGGHPPRPPARF